MTKFNYGIAKICSDHINILLHILAVLSKSCYTFYDIRLQAEIHKYIIPLYSMRKDAYLFITLLFGIVTIVALVCDIKTCLGSFSGKHARMLLWSASGGSRTVATS